MRTRALLLVCAAACEEGLALPDAAPDAPLMKTIGGVAGVTYQSDEGPEWSPFDLSEATIQAIYGQGEDEFRWQGHGEPDGTFSVRARDTSVLVRLEDTYVAVAGQEVDLRWELEGRSNSLWPTAPIPLRFQLFGLAPWSFDQSLVLYATNLGVYTRCPECDSDTFGPGTGATALLDYLADWQGLLIEASQGDRAVLLQTLKLTSELGCSYTTPGKVLELPDIEMQQGSETLIAGGLSDLPLRATPFAVALAQFAQLRAEVHAEAVHTSTDVYLAARPPGASLSWWPPATLVNLASSASIDRDCGSLDYGDPFPAAWSRYAYVEYTARRRALVGEIESSAFGSILTTVDVTAVDEGPVAPLVGPPQRLLLDGGDATIDQAIGLDPVLSWEPPVVGTATAYEVRLRRFTDEYGYPGFVTRAVFYTAGTSLAIPRGLLGSGAYYVVGVTAIHSPSVDPTVAPYREELPYGRADALTGVLTVE